MGFKDEKIDYTSFLRDKPQETDPEKLATMKDALVRTLKERDVHGHVGVFDSRKGEFFSGYVGGRK